LLVLPTKTLPKLRAAGLTPTAAEAVVFVVEVAEEPAALVMPEQPDRMAATKMIVANRSRERAGEIVRLWDGIGAWAKC
jgi:hypothetical protein